MTCLTGRTDIAAPQFSMTRPDASRSHCAADHGLTTSGLRYAALHPGRHGFKQLGNEALQSRILVRRKTFEIHQIMASVREDTNGNVGALPTASAPAIPMTRLHSIRNQAPRKRSMVLEPLQVGAVRIIEAPVSSVRSLAWSSV